MSEYMPISLRNWIQKHKTAILVSAGAAGIGYACYKCVKAHYTSVQDREAQESSLQQAESRAKSQHYTSVQEREAQESLHQQAESRAELQSLLPSVLPRLKLQLLDQIDLSCLTAKLLQKGDLHQMLSKEEKLELWKTLKILSFSQAFSSMCSLTLMILLVRVQLNILARHIYIDTDADISNGGLAVQEKSSTTVQQNYLAFKEFLPHEGLGVLIKDVKVAVKEVIELKTLGEPCTVEDLQQIFADIAKCLIRTQTSWSQYLLPKDMRLFGHLLSKSLGLDIMEAKELLSLQNEERMRSLLEETQAILDSKEFEEIFSSSLVAVINQVAEDFDKIYQEQKTSSLPLVKLFFHLQDISKSFLDQPEHNRFVELVIKLPQLYSFCGLVYSAV